LVGDGGDDDDDDDEINWLERAAGRGLQLEVGVERKVEGEVQRGG